MKYAARRRKFYQLFSVPRQPWTYLVKFDMYDDILIIKYHLFCFKKFNLVIIIFSVLSLILSEKWLLQYHYCFWWIFYYFLCKLIQLKQCYEKKNQVNLSAVIEVYLIWRNTSLLHYPDVEFRSIFCTYLRYTWL